MKKYVFRFRGEWYFTDGVPTRKTKMTILYLDNKRRIREDDDRYQYIRGWTDKELQDMFEPIIDSCVLT